MNKKVTIIILNWNGWEDTTECLESLQQVNYNNFDILIVDNASNDDSINKIKRYCAENHIFYNRSLHQNVKPQKNEKKEGLKIFIIENKKNYGFAKGNNIGIKYAINNLNPYFILILNNDTIVTKTFLTELMKPAVKDEIGICSPKILNFKNPKLIDSTGHVISWGRIVDRGHNKIDKNQYDDKLEIIGAKAAACLYKVEMLKSIGLFNEEYITTYEDAELSWRANKKQWKAQYVPQAIVYHKISKSIKKNSQILVKMRKLSLNNIVRTVNFYGNILQKIQFTVILVKAVFINIVLKFYLKNNPDTLEYIQAIYNLYK